MGHSEKTTNFQLPIITDTDKPTWRGDFNAAMHILDEKAGGTNTQISAALALATEAKSDASDALGRAIGAESRVESISETANRLADVDGIRIQDDRLLAAAVGFPYFNAIGFALLFLCLLFLTALFVTRFKRAEHADNQRNNGQDTHGQSGGD